MFTWKPMYRELAEKLMAYRDRQNELLAILKEIEDKGSSVIRLQDVNSAGKDIPLTVMDPFSFYASFNRGIKEDTRRSILAHIKDRFNLSSAVPSDFHGIPVANKQNAWFFPFSESRKKNDISSLWDIAEACLSKPPKQLDPVLFARCLEIKQVRAAKLTMGLFWFNPDQYIAMDGVMADYLKDKGLTISSSKIRTLADYTSIVESVRRNVGSDFPLISRQAYVAANEFQLDLEALNLGLQNLLADMAERNGMTVEQIIASLSNAPGDTELTNRVRVFPLIRDALATEPLNMSVFRKACSELWALGGRQDTIRRNAFLDSDVAASAINDLIDSAAQVEVSDRVDRFVAIAVSNGFSSAKSKDPAGAAHFASVILSALYPEQYVDFRVKRWNGFYALLTGSEEALCRGGPIGVKLARAGTLGAALAETTTFKKHLGIDHGTWKAAGLAWYFGEGLFNIKTNGDHVKRYWAGGFLWGGTESKLEEFIAGNYWQHGYSKDHPKGEPVWSSFGQITPGDEFAIKGFGGRNDLNIHYIGEVKAIDPDNGTVTLTQLNRKLYRGKAPKAGTKGNWFGTLLKVTDSDAIQTVFHGVADTGDGRTSDIPLNTILYGPPGTGKTWTLRNEYMVRFTEEAAALSQDDFAAEMVAEMSWLEVITMVMLKLKSAKVRDIQSHPLMQARIKRANNRHPKAAIWAHLQMHTKKDCPEVNYTKRYEPLFFWKDNHSVWSIDETLALEAVPELLEKVEQYENFKPGRGDKIERFAFTTFHQSYSYEDFVEGIKPVMGEEGMLGEVPDALAYEIVPGIFKKMVQSAMADPKHDYALIIDEINRGNVANIFGELITLIEDDKRKGAQNELSAVLPYSRDKFVVPPNLHIIGAMNTADRSVEALDTALRRRFTFLAVPPQPDLIPQPKKLNVNLQQLLSCINARIERLLDKDHCIGHSYFYHIAENVSPLDELRAVFGTKVIPLLEEYFYGDPAKIGMVLGDRFVTAKDQDIQWAAGDWGLDEFEERRMYTLCDCKTLTEDDFRSIYA